MPFEHVYPQNTVFLLYSSTSITLNIQQESKNGGIKKNNKISSWTLDYLCWLKQTKNKQVEYSLKVVSLKCVSRGVHFAENMEINFRILYNKCNMYHILGKFTEKWRVFGWDWGYGGYMQLQGLTLRLLSSTTNRWFGCSKRLNMNQLDPLMIDRTPASATVWKRETKLCILWYDTFYTSRESPVLVTQTQNNHSGQSAVQISKLSWQNHCWELERSLQSYLVVTILAENKKV